MTIREFNASKDWNKVMWKETLWLNFLRALCVTPVMVIFFLLGQGGDSGVVMFAILWPIYYFIAVPFFVFILRPIMFAILGPLANLLWIPLCLVFICGGDPYV